MLNLKLVAATGAAATALGIGGLAATPSASAAPLSCEQAQSLARTYAVLGRLSNQLGHFRLASYWYGRSEGLLDAACGPDDD